MSPIYYSIMKSWCSKMSPIRMAYNHFHREDHNLHQNIRHCPPNILNNHCCRIPAFENQVVPYLLTSILSSYILLSKLSITYLAPAVKYDPITTPTPCAAPMTPDELLYCSCLYPPYPALLELPMELTGPPP